MFFPPAVLVSPAVHHDNGTDGLCKVGVGSCPHVEAPPTSGRTAEYANFEPSHQLNTRTIGYVCIYRIVFVMWLSCDITDSSSASDPPWVSRTAQGDDITLPDLTSSSERELAELRDSVTSEGQLAYYVALCITSLGTEWVCGGGVWCGWRG